MNRRSLLGNATLQMALTVVIVILANVWASSHFFRVDLTESRLHSLDDASKGIVGSLDKPLTVRVYFTHGLEAPYNNHEQALRDKLEELRAYAKGKLQFTVVDPDGEKSVIAEAQKYGLTPLQYTVRHEDRSELRTVWMGAVLIYGDRTEVLPALSNLSTLEYDLVGAIHRLQQKIKDRPVIAFTVGHGEPDLTKPDGPLRALTESIGKKAYLAPLELGGTGEIAEQVDALLVIGPQQTLSDRALYQIDQFVMRGGAAAIFVTNTRPDMRTLRTERVNSGLEPLLGGWGVKVGRDIVLDRVENGAMRFPVRVGGKTGVKEINYPLIAKATDLSDSSVVTAGIDSLLVPFAAPVELADPLPEGVKAEVLARSSPSSGSVSNLEQLEPAQFSSVLPGEKRGPFPLVVGMTGAWRSFFETRPVPAADPDVPDEQDGMGADAPLLVEGSPTRLLVSGSADVVANNPAFMLNVCDWLLQDEALIGIRSKTATVPSLTATSSGERTGWRVFNLAAGPLLLFGAGGLRQLWLRRRAARKAA